MQSHMPYASNSFASRSLVYGVLATSLGVATMAQAAPATLISREHTAYRFANAEVNFVPNTIEDDAAWEHEASLDPYSFASISNTADTIVPGLRVVAFSEVVGQAAFVGTEGRFSQYSMSKEGSAAIDRIVIPPGSGASAYPIANTQIYDAIVFSLDAPARITLSGTVQNRGSLFNPPNEYRDNASTHLSFGRAAFDEEAGSWSFHGAELLSVSGASSSQPYSGTFDAILPAGNYRLAGYGGTFLGEGDLVPTSLYVRNADSYLKYSANLSITDAAPDATPTQFASTGEASSAGTVSAAISGIQDFGSFAATYEPQANAESLFGSTPTLPSGVIILETEGTVQAWEISFDGSFDGTATLTFNYDPTLLPEGLDAAALGVLHYTGGQWVSVPTVVDPALHTVTVTVSDFSPFVLAIVPEPASLALLAFTGAAMLRRRRT